MCLEMEISKILKITTFALSGARHHPDSPFTLSVLSALSEFYRRPLEQWTFQGFIVSLSPIYEKYYCSQEAFQQTMDSLTNSQIPTDHLKCIRRLVPLFILLFDQAQEIYHGKQFEQLAAFLDGIHGLPQALISRAKWNPKDYWKVYLLPYQTQWDKSFLKGQKKEFF